MAETTHGAFSAEVKTMQKRAKKYEYLEARIELPDLEGWQIIPIWAGSDDLLEADGTLVIRARKAVASEESEE